MSEEIEEYPRGNSLVERKRGNAGETPCQRGFVNPPHSSASGKKNGMLSRAAVISVLICMASCLVVEGRVGNCSQQSQGLYLSEVDGDSVVVTSGHQTILSSAIDGVVQPDSFFINFTTLGFAERDKFTSNDLEGVCATPSGLGSTPFDPVASQGPASPIRRYHEAQEFDCFIYRNERIINNTNIKGNFIKYSRDDYPGWETTISFEYADSDVTQIASDDTTYTFGTYTRSPGRT